MREPRIAFNNRMWSAQDLSEMPYIAQAAIDETGWTMLAYGIASMGHFDVYEKDNQTLVALDKLEDDAVSLALGIFTIDVPHLKPCNRFICNCKPC